MQKESTLKTKAKKLYLFTNVYPFGQDEVFVENEVKVLAACFEEIHIFPAKKETTIRSCPSNVKLHLPNVKLGSSNSFFLLISHCSLFLKILLGEMRSNGIGVFFKYLRRNISVIAKSINYA